MSDDSLAAEMLAALKAYEETYMRTRCQPTPIEEARVMALVQKALWKAEKVQFGPGSDAEAGQRVSVRP